VVGMHRLRSPPFLAGGPGGRSGAVRAAVPMSSVAIGGTVAPR
jgi:hypothetical protein